MPAERRGELELLLLLLLPAGQRGELELLLVLLPAGRRGKLELLLLLVVRSGYVALGLSLVTRIIPFGFASHERRR